MGAGKTAFTSGGRGLSPCRRQITFALVHQYGNGEHALYHFDMYRVESYEDLYSTGFFDYPCTMAASSPSSGARTSKSVTGGTAARSEGDDLDRAGFSSGGPDFLSHFWR